MQRRVRQRRGRLSLTRTSTTGRLDRPLQHPALRFGAGLRRVHFDAVLGGEIPAGLDFLEVIPENFMGFGGKTRRVLETARARLPVVTHGVSLSLGSPDPVDPGYLDRLADLLGWLDPPWHSDHVSVSSAHGVEYHDLLPVPLDEAMLERMAGRLRQVAARLGRPILVENPTVYTLLPGGDIPEPVFLGRLLAASGCRLLLDVNNVWVNARNHGGDPFAYLEALPAGCVGQFHMAGHRLGGPLVVDSHGAPVAEEVRELYGYALRRLGPAWTLLERDAAVPSLEDLAAEVEELRQTACRALAAPEVTVSLPAPGPAVLPRPEGDAAAAQELLHRVVVGGETPAAAAAVLEIPEAGLRLYQSFFRRHHREILELPYRILFSTLDEDTAADLVRGYQADHPMSQREINANAAAFPEWLAARVAGGAAGVSEFHAELAVLERERFARYATPVELPAPDTLAGPTLNPTLEVLQLRYPVADYVDAWAAAQAAGAPPPPAPARPAPEPELLFVYRDPASLEGRACRAGPRLLFAFKVLHDGLSPEAAALEAGRDPDFVAAALQAAVEQGVALAPA